MQEALIEKNPIVKKTVLFSLMAIEYCETLNVARKFIISNQLMRSATSIGANVMEAQNAESRRDFIHKMKIAAKEADEVQYWLILCQWGKNYPDCIQLNEKLNEIQKILNAIIGSSKTNKPNP